MLADGLGPTVNRRRLSNGELEETQSHLKICRDLDYVADKKYFRIARLIVVLDKMLVKLMRRG